MSDNARKFEEAISRLEAIVTRLERGDASLDESLAMFEEGTGLVKYCSGVLNAAEETVIKLTQGADGKPVESSFEVEE